MDLDISGGWLSSLLGNGSIPGAVGPTSVGGAPLVSPDAPSMGAGLQALGQAAPAIQKAMAPANVPAPQIAMPQSAQGGQYAQALAQIMAKLKAQNTIGPGGLPAMAGAATPTGI